MISKATCCLEAQKGVARVWAKHCWVFTLHSSCSSSRHEFDGFGVASSKLQVTPRKTEEDFQQINGTFADVATQSGHNITFEFKTSRSWGIESQELKAEYKKRKASKSLESTRVDTSWSSFNHAKTADVGFERLTLLKASYCIVFHRQRLFLECIIVMWDMSHVFQAFYENANWDGLEKLMMGAGILKEGEPHDPDRTESTTDNATTSLWGRFWLFLARQKSVRVPQQDLDHVGAHEHPRPHEVGQVATDL